MTDERIEMANSNPDRMTIDVSTRVWPLPADLPSNHQFHFDDITIFAGRVFRWRLSATR